MEAKKMEIKKYISKGKNEKNKNEENHFNNVESDTETNYEIEEQLNVIHQHVSKANKGSDVRVQLQNQSETKNVLDSGASSTFVNKDVLKYVNHKIENVNIQSKGRHKATKIEEQATFSIKLIDITSSKTVSVMALVENSKSVVGRHAIVFGTSIRWDDHVIPMRTISGTEINCDDIDPLDADLPKFMQQRVPLLSTSIRTDMTIITTMT